MKIIIPGIPVPQARMKHATRGSFTTTYDPRAKEKKEIRKMMDPFSPSKFPEFPRVSFLFHMPIPASIPKKKRALYESGRLKHTKKPDADNLAKLYMDCMSEIIYEDDKAVSLGPCNKVYHPEPKTIIWINEMQEELTLLELDPLVVSSECDELKPFEKVFPFGFDSHLLLTR